MKYEPDNCLNINNQKIITPRHRYNVFLINTFVKNTSGEYVDANSTDLDVQDPADPRFLKYNSTNGKFDGSSTPVVDELIGPHGKEQQFPRETLEYLLRRAEPYANEANVGGSTDYVRGFIELKHDVRTHMKSRYHAIN